ncbi:MAG TPA: flagellar motor switch protein FliG [Gammaproteobacteria bacterium]|jgi:flagellar motor switch protein FliG|nr:flagellar motor switch protein FliG [Gammaproteobacteria bacterium]
MAEATTVKGTERAAILLLTLGEQTAASVLRHMDVEEVQKLGSAMAGLTDVPRERVSDVLGELLVAVQKKTSIGFGTAEYLRKVLTDSLGERRASTLLGRILKGRDSTGIDALKWMDPRTVADVVKNEHPQIVATILAHLPSQQAADVLKRFDPGVQSEVAVRIARLDEVPETALQELDAIVERQTKEATQLKTARLGGVKAAADMINLLGPSGQTSVIDAIKAQDAELGEQIKDALFVFENLLKVDDRGMQAILREVQADVLSTALKAADEEVKEKVFKNMSKRAVEILRDDIASKGPVRLSDVETAQKEILAVALRLAEEGTITLAAGGDEFV